MRKATLEIDHVTGCAFPPKDVSHNGQTHTLEAIYADAGIELEVVHSDPALPELANGAPFDLPTLHAYMVQYRKPYRSDWYGHVLIVPKIAYQENFGTKTPLGIMYDARLNDANNVAREGCALSFDPLGRNPLAFLRTTAHEVGHVFNLLHPKDERPPRPIDTTIMNQTVDLERLGGFPSNIRFEFNEANKAFLSTAPADFVRPGGAPFGDRPEDERALGTDLAFSSTPGLKFTVSTKQKSYLLGDPIYLRMSLRNMLDKAILVNPDLAGFSGVVQVTVVTPLNRQVEFRPCYFECVEPEVHHLTRGKEVLGNTPIFYGANGHTFRSPGEYKVFATYQAVVQGNPLTAISNVHKFEIQSPVSSADFDESDNLMNPNAAFFLTIKGGNHLPGAIESLTKIVKDHGEGNAAQYARLSLAKNLLKKDAQSVIGLVNSINEDRLDYEQRAEIHGLATQAYAMLGERAKAQSSKARLRQVVSFGMPGDEARVMDRLEAQIGRIG